MRTNWHSIREFEALRALVGAGTTTAAARRLGVSQSAVSRALAQLEARMGRTLFEREAGRLWPNAEALSLNERLDPFFDALAQIDGERWPGAAESRVRLVAPPTIAHRFLLKRIASFLKADPNRRVSLEICTSDEIVSGLLDDRWDVGLTSADVTRSGMKLMAFRLSRMVCVAPADHPLAARETVRPEDLDGVPFIALTRRHGVRAQIDQMLAAVGARPRIVAETATGVAACELARSGLGVTLINPFPLLKGNEADIAIRAWAPIVEYRTSFAISATRPLPSLARSFIRHVRLTTRNDGFSEPM